MKKLKRMIVSMYINRCHASDDSSITGVNFAKE